jgi:nitrogen-specific signal transduction histidine kinase
MNQNNGNVFVLVPKGNGHQACQFESGLAFKVMSPLSNITLANEMMDANNEDEDMKLFSDIIKRNCHRINQLIIDSRMEISLASV